MDHLTTIDRIIFLTLVCLAWLGVESGIVYYLHEFGYAHATWLDRALGGRACRHAFLAGVMARHSAGGELRPWPALHTKRAIRPLGSLLIKEAEKPILRFQSPGCASLLCYVTIVSLLVVPASRHQVHLPLSSPHHPVASRTHLLPHHRLTTPCPSPAIYLPRQARAVQQIQERQKREQEQEITTAEREDRHTRLVSNIIAKVKSQSRSNSRV